jgi:hypothetical protein
MLKRSPLLDIIVFLPASIIATILSLPLMIFNMIINLILPKKYHEKITANMLYDQHALSLSWPYLFIGYFIDKENLMSFLPLHIIMGSFIGLLFFYRSVREMVHENINGIHIKN